MAAFKGSRAMKGVNVALSRIDRGMSKVKTSLKQLNESPYVKVGVLGKSGKHDKDGALTNGKLAIIQEFGTSSIPARPFIGPTAAKNKASYQAIVKRYAGKVITGATAPDAVLGLVGTQMAADIKKYVTQGAGVPPPNSPVTIAAKGSSRPLVDTGRLVGSVTYSVERGKLKK